MSTRKTSGKADSGAAVHKCYWSFGESDLKSIEETATCAISIHSSSLTIREAMKAVLIHEYDGPEVLWFEESPDPVPGKGEVFQIQQEEKHNETPR